MTPILSKPYYRSELDLLPTKSTNPETTNWRCLMASEGNGFTHYLVSKGVVLGEACIIEQATSGSRLHSSSSESTGRKL